MKKNISLYEADRGFKNAWNGSNDLETIAIGENLYLLTFSSAKECDRILKKQPWNFKGALIILNKVVGDKSPSDLSFHSMPF